MIPLQATPAVDRRPPFFGVRPPGEPGLALFLNAGDPPMPVLREIVSMLDEARVDCLELAVPFPDSVTDGPVVRRSARRALAQDVVLDDVLGFIAATRPTLRHLRVTLLADWHHTVRPTALPDFLRRVRDSGADALLLHALPPRMAGPYRDRAADLGIAVVGTCYAVSDPPVRATAARTATAFLYLVARYGRTGDHAASEFDRLADVLADLRGQAHAPIAVGFGVRDRADVTQLHRAGADAVIVGSAAVSRVELALQRRLDVAGELHQFVRMLRPAITSERGNPASPITIHGRTS